ncbi:MAG: hypothetical protein HRU75_04345 [Planctomycetia bacterium]|nr:MAG: hypothetical protein HRU75_04345 [Planctomycetia bacterium]
MYSDPPRSNRGRSLMVLAAIGGLFALTALWPLSSPPQAQAQVPDSGAQRAAMLAELRATNQKLAEIAEILREIRTNTAPAGAKTAAPARGADPR